MQLHNLFSIFVDRLNKYNISYVRKNFIVHRLKHLPWR